jgi:hypothetical protein
MVLSIIFLEDKHKIELRLYRETDTVLKKSVDTHKILINAIKLYVCLQEI